MSTLYIAATPIGNYRDISLRVMDTIKDADFVICENEKEYKRLTFGLGLPLKDYIVSDRKNEHEAMTDVIARLDAGKNGVLVTDCGTPLFEDPGFPVINQARIKGHKIVSLPGANSLITALTLVPFEVKTFYFGGFISQKKGERETDLLRLLKRKETVIILETPYRLTNMLELLKNYSPEREICIPYNLTMDDEKIYSGKPDKVFDELQKDNVKKGEFLVIIRGK